MKAELLLCVCVIQKQASSSAQLAAGALYTFTGRLLTGRCFDGWFGCTRQSKSLTNSTLNKFFWAKEKSLKFFPIYINCVQGCGLIRMSHLY